MDEMTEEEKKEVISKITEEVKGIKSGVFLRFYLELLQSFKRKWGV